jgi:hypothetical protein
MRCTGWGHGVGYASAYRGPAATVLITLRVMSWRRRQVLQPAIRGGLFAISLTEDFGDVSQMIEAYGISQNDAIEPAAFGYWLFVVGRSLFGIEAAFLFLVSVVSCDAPPGAHS